MFAVLEVAYQGKWWSELIRSCKSVGFDAGTYHAEYSVLMKTSVLSQPSILYFAED